MSLRVNHNMSAINTHRSVLNNSNAKGIATRIQTKADKIKTKGNQKSMPKIDNCDKLPPHKYSSYFSMFGDGLEIIAAV